LTALANEACRLALGAVGLTIAYGMARARTGLSTAARRGVCPCGVSVPCGCLRFETFETHIHQAVDALSYHAQETGGLSRIIERGVTGVEFPAALLLFPRSEP